MRIQSYMARDQRVDRETVFHETHRYIQHADAIRRKWEGARILHAR